MHAGVQRPACCAFTAHRRERRPAAGLTRRPRRARYNKSLAREAVAEYARVAERHGLTPTQLALAWCKSRWNVASTIIGATSMEQLKVNCCPQTLSTNPDPRACTGDAEALRLRWRAYQALSCSTACSCRLGT